MEEILLEKKLTTEFTIGFELEAIWNDSNDSEEDYDDDDDEQHYRRSNVWGDIESLFDSNFPGGDLHEDGSLDGNGTPFEWASPVLPFNVGTMNKIIEFYRKHLGREFYVNNSCGYHNHISFQGISVEDVVWIMCKLALDDHMRDLISNFEGIEFVSGWSNDEYLNDLEEAVHNLDYSRIVQLCNTQKYSLVNVHRNKTLEWRGPRGFLNEEDPDLIIKFYKRLYKFISWMADVLDENEIEGVSKENFLDMIRSALPNDKRIANFYSSHKVKGLLKPETLSKFVQEIINDNTKIFKFIGNIKPLEQVIQKLYNMNRLGFIIKRLNENEEINQGNLLILNNIAWKYIPYRMGADYMDKITGDVIANSSKLTMDRLWSSARKDGNSLTYNDKFNVLTKALNKIPTADIISPTHFPKLYNLTDDWSNGFETIVKINQNGWLKKIENIERCFQTCSVKLMEDNRIADLMTMIEIFKGKVNFANYYAPYASIFASNPESYIDIIKTLAQDEKEDIIKRAKESGNAEEVLQLFKAKNIISNEDEARIMAQMTNDSRNNINQMVQGETE